VRGRRGRVWRSHGWRAARRGRRRAWHATRWWATRFLRRCHPAPLPDPHLHGDLAPSLAGAGARWSAGQLRLRLVDPQRLVPGSLMPAYHRIDGLRRVDPAWQGRPLLSAQEIEDVVAWLVTLKE
jgi:hypothetical protein